MLLIANNQMNEDLKNLLYSLNCSIVNPVRKSLYDKEVVAWYIKSANILRKEKNLKEINKFIEDNSLEYYTVDTNETTPEFLIHIN